MSTLAYAQLINAREARATGMGLTTESTGIKGYIEMFAALVPAEVLALHSVIISLTTRTLKNARTAGDAAAETITMILPDAVLTLQCTFWLLVALAFVLYAVPRFLGGKWRSLDWVRVLVPPSAFVGWTMIQRPTAFDAVFPDVPEIPRTVAALFLAVILAFVSTLLGTKGDRQEAPAN